MIKMKKSLLSIVAISTLFVVIGCTEKGAEESHVKVNFVNNAEIQNKGMAQIKGILMKLKPTIKSSLKEDKTGLAGVEMCSTSAIEMGKAYNATLPTDSSIRRTALKYRNPNNKPDATDIAVMKKFIESKDFKKPLVVEMDDSFRVYKALPIIQPCLACHGAKKDMNAKTVEMIEKKYPHDLAIDFKLGELRGVVISNIKK